MRNNKVKYASRRAGYYSAYKRLNQRKGRAMKMGQLDKVAELEQQIKELQTARINKDKDPETYQRLIDNRIMNPRRIK